MTSRRLVSLALLLALLFAALLAEGCTRATVSVRQPDGTYKTSEKLVFRSSFDDMFEFECDTDYEVATEMHGITVYWPKGRGEMESLERTVFEGDDLQCVLEKRTLTVNGKTFGPYAEGDRIRIAPNGEVFVNEDESNA